MIVDIVMPKMGESLQEGTIIRWTKKIGEMVERDETILEITTDKVDTEVPSPVAGILKTLLYNENDTVPVGTKIAEVETDASVVNTTTEQPKAATPEQTSQVTNLVADTVAPTPTSPASLASTTNGNFVDIVMPKMGESLQEGTIIRWTKKIGDIVERDETILEITTDKVDTEVPSPVSGILAELLAKENETVPVGQVIARIQTEGGSVTQSHAIATEAPITTTSLKLETPAPDPQPTPQPTQVVAGSTYDIPVRDGENFYSPLVREIAQQNKISLEELRTIQGNGVDGRITKDDIMNYINNRETTSISTLQPPVSTSTPPQAPSVIIPKPQPESSLTYDGEINPIFRAAGDYEVIKMDRVRQLISEHMTRSKATSAHVTSVAEADVTDIVKFRDKYKDEFQRKEGFKLTYTPFFALAAIDGIKQFPGVNVGVDGSNIIKFKHINLSIATALDDGNLIVPVIKKAEEMNFTGIARQIYDLSTRARTKKLNPDDIQGGTFSVTNVGTFGTLFGTPVINQPQTAIMGIGAIQKRPVVKEVMGNDMILVRSMAYVSITYDHRVIDGMLAGQCLAAICNSLENMNENTIRI